MVPLIVPADEWSRLEEGLIQRTRLLNLILLDLHGPQRLLRSGLLPPSLALANPAFLRPCHGIPVPRDIYLHMHGVDLARVARWRVGRARRSHAGAVGRGLCAREPPRPPAQPAGSVPRVRDSAAGRLLPLAARHAERARAGARAAGQGRAPDAGTLQRDLLRARVPGAVSRLHARRRRRPDGARSPRLHQDARGPAARQRDLPPPRRQLLRSARAPRRLLPRRRGPRRRRPRRQRRRRQRPRLGRDRDRRAPAVPAVALPRAPRRGAAASLGADLVVRPAGRARLRHRAPRPARHQAGLSLQEAGSDLRTASSARANGRSSPRRFAPGPRTSPRRRTSNCRARRCGTGSASSRGRSCSGPMSAPPATRSRSCPAA